MNQNVQIHWDHKGSHLQSQHSFRRIDTSSSLGYIVKLQASQDYIIYKTLSQNKNICTCVYAHIDRETPR